MLTFYQKTTVIIFCFAFVTDAFGCPRIWAEGPSYNRDIRPILSTNCFFCHGFDAEHREADLRLDTAEGATSNGHGAAAIVPGSPEHSELWRRITSNDESEIMPPEESHKKLSAEQKALLKDWIENGAKYEDHWAFVVPTKSAIPSGLNPIDFFVEKRLLESGLKLSEPAKKNEILRRISLDLTGLPPTVDELVAFEADKRTDAFDRVLDRLFNSPRYGEHMAMSWLDAARYADTNGYQMDAYHMNWPWRDWVIKAFNANMPFDQFTIEQLAGDLLPNPTQDQLIATAFNRNHMLNAEGGTIAEENRTKGVFDRVETTSTVWLGLTMNCTQCHDHKFDPLTQRDYYSMFAIFNQIGDNGKVDKRFIKKPYSDTYDSLYMLESPYIILGSEEQQQELKSVAKAADEAKKQFEKETKNYYGSFVRWVQEMREQPDLILERVNEEMTRRFVTTAPLDKPSNGNTQKLLREFLATQPQGKEIMDAFDQARDREEQLRKAMPHVMVMQNNQPRDTFVLLRGSYEMKGDRVDPATPTFLPSIPSGTKADRLALANWLVHEQNPLTARVTVNRLWQHMFGKGLVATPDDFGLQGDFPSHPELLDWLAVEFSDSGWNIKHILRLIATSRTYQQSAKTTPELLSIDPENHLLSRSPRFRLDSRSLRDQALFLSGLLVEKVGGPSVMPYQPDGIWEEMSFGKNRYFRDSGENLYRRSLYTVWRRSVAPASFFDVPSRQVCAVKPTRTSTPLHALTTLNDPTFVEAARVWAQKLLNQDENDELRIEQAFQSATSRLPEMPERVSLNLALKNARTLFADENSARKLVAAGESPRDESHPVREHAAWTTLCLLILNMDESLSR